MPCSGRAGLWFSREGAVRTRKTDHCALLGSRRAPQVKTLFIKTLALSYLEHMIEP